MLFSYPVYFDKKGEFTAQFKTTIMVKDGKITNLCQDQKLPYVKSEYNLSDDLMRVVVGIFLPWCIESEKNMVQMPWEHRIEATMQFEEIMLID